MQAVQAVCTGSTGTYFFLCMFKLIAVIMFDSQVETPVWSKSTHNWSIDPALPSARAGRGVSVEIYVLIEPDCHGDGGGGL